jgi:hypothetical protein
MRRIVGSLRVMYESMGMYRDTTMALNYNGITMTNEMGIMYAKDVQHWHVPLAHALPPGHDHLHVI